MTSKQATQENLKQLLSDLGDKLGVANRILVDEKYYDLNKYDDLKFLYDHVSRMDNISPSEIEACIGELRTMRNDA